MLIDEGALRRENGRWVAADLSRIAAPATIHALLASRLDQLDPVERAVLERGCDRGPGVPSQRRRVPGAGCGASWRRGSAVDTRPEGTGRARGRGVLTDHAFRFHHLLLRDVAYESIQKEERASLHERFAVWLDDQAGERASEYDEIAGYHLEQAVRYQTELRIGGSPDGKLSERAGARLGSAGLRAHARGDWPAAVSLLTRAQTLLPAGADARSALDPRLADALLEIAPREPSLLRSLRCFWGWRPGHRWTVKARTGVLTYRCAACGKERNAEVRARCSIPMTESRRWSRSMSRLAWMARRRMDGRRGRIAGVGR